MCLCFFVSERREKKWNNQGENVYDNSMREKGREIERGRFQEIERRLPVIEGKEVEDAN